jgi:hypothetical protein
MEFVPDALRVVQHFDVNRQLDIVLADEQTLGALPGETARFHVMHEQQTHSGETRFTKITCKF